MLISSDYEITTAHKKENAENRLFFLLLNSDVVFILQQFWPFNIYEQYKFNAQLCLSMKKFYNLRASTFANEPVHMILVHVY